MPLSIDNVYKIETFWQKCLEHQYANIGYPESADFNYENLKRFMSFSLNNCGDWQEESNYFLNSFEFEQEVIAYFAELYQIPLTEAWGYVTNGGTEGNMFGCYLAREKFPEGKLYCSTESHYSVFKAGKLLRMDTCLINALPNGEIDYEHLLKSIKQNKDHHPVIVANIGTTMKGAIDQISIIQQLMAQNGFERKNYYIHADAALSGLILPYLDSPQGYSFKDGVDSISVSGHKMVGSPIPCGVVMCKKINVNKIANSIDYIAAHDLTLSGSRNGITPLILWHFIFATTRQEKKIRIQKCLDLAEYAVKQFNYYGIKAWRNRNSITVVFPAPSAAIWKKHGLATAGQDCHIVTTAHLNKQRIDEVVQEIAFDLKTH